MLERRRERASTEELQVRPASITREQRCAAAYQYRVDSQSVLVDEGQLRCLDGEPSDGSWP